MSFQCHGSFLWRNQMSSVNKAKILLLDIETAPAKCYTWGLFDQNIGLNQIIEDGYMLCWSAKWLGEARIYYDALPNHATYKVRPTDDREIVRSIWKLIDDADIVVAHNGANFDIKWLNALFLKHGMRPPASYKVVDTLTEAKSIGRFISNKLEWLVKKLEVGAKMDTGGFELWTGCMSGDKRAWVKMITYNRKDVLILEKLYLKLRPFMKRHPNLALYNEDRKGCPNCASTVLRKKGFAYTAVGKFQRYICLNCGKDTRDGKPIINKEERSNVKRII